MAGSLCGFWKTDLGFYACEASSLSTEWLHWALLRFFFTLKYDSLADECIYPDLNIVPVCTYESITWDSFHMYNWDVFMYQ